MADLIDRVELRKDFCNMCEAMQPEMIDCNKKGCMSMKIIDEQPAVNRWISVEDALPEKDGEYLVFTEYEDVFKCTFDSNEENKWGFEQDYRDPDTLGWAGATWTAVENVTHWMPLPEPPEKE